MLSTLSLFTYLAMSKYNKLDNGGVMLSVDMTDQFDQMKRKMVFDQYAGKVAYYQRLIKPTISEEMAKGILELCAAMIYNDNPSDEEMNVFSEKVADKRGLDVEELCSEFFEFCEYVHGE